MITSLIVITTIFLSEVLLSLDNSIALAAMVKELPEKQQKKALLYGLVGGYLFRFLSLFFVSILISIAWLKALGGIYLIYLAIKFFKNQEEETKEHKIYKSFFLVVLNVEILDLSLSIDQIFAANALTNSIFLIVCGVFTGILALRLFSIKLIKVIERFPSLINSAYIVILLLGFKLFIIGSLEFFENQGNVMINLILILLTTHTFDLIFSGLMLLIFFFPIITKKLKLKSI